MVTLQNDILYMYNQLVIFSNDTVKSDRPLPITVHFEKNTNSIVFEQKGNSVRMSTPLYYCLGFDTITKPTYLLPEDYDYLMNTFQTLLSSGELIKDRVSLSPENYGFDVYNINSKEFWKGPDILGQVRFISGTSWFFKYRTRKKYKL